MRGKGKQTIVWLLMGMLVLGLGGFGVTNFSGGTADVGGVGNVTISSQEYARALRNEMREFAARTGRQVTPAEAKTMGIDQMALSRIYTSAALENEAQRIGVSVGDHAVAQQIDGIQEFKGMNGKFDRTLYGETLRREGIRESEFEHDLRMGEARMILQQAALAGVAAPQAVADLAQAWLLETRDIHWRELTEADLTAPIAQPDQPTLEAWHKANADRFTSPELRKITYVWLTPDMLQSTVQVDEKALQDLYQSRISEFQQPERRMVERLVFPSVATAAEAKARLDKGETTFEKLAADRGLSLNDIDLGEVSKAQLGAAGDAVFALDQPGIAGPAESDLGPALYSMNAILEPVNITFEQARNDLRLEAAVDRARRTIEEKTPQLSDELAGGATLADLAKDGGMTLGHIDWNPSAEADPDSIDAYPAFRQHAAEVTDKTFPELIQLDDGGIFALQLDSIVPPALIPFDQIRDRVADDWRKNELHRQLLALAEDRKVQAEAAVVPGVEPAPTAATAPVAQAVGAAAAPNVATTPQVTPAPEAPKAAEAGTPAVNLARGGFINGVPQSVVGQAFAIKTEGDTEVVDAENRVFLITLDKIHQASKDGEEAQQIRDGVSARLTDSLRQDVFDYFARALQTQGGVTVNQTAIDAANAQIQ